MSHYNLTSPIQGPIAEIPEVFKIIRKNLMNLKDQKAPSKISSSRPNK